MLNCIIFLLLGCVMINSDIQQGSIFTVYFAADKCIFYVGINTTNENNITYLDPVVYKQLNYSG